MGEVSEDGTVVRPRQQPDGQNLQQLPDSQSQSRRQTMQLPAMGSSLVEDNALELDEGDMEWGSEWAIVLDLTNLTSSHI